MLKNERNSQTAPYFPTYMRVFHFVNEDFGLEDLRRHRLKIATLHELTLLPCR